MGVAPASRIVGLVVTPLIRAGSAHLEGILTLLPQFVTVTLHSMKIHHLNTLVIPKNKQMKPSEVMQETPRKKGVNLILTFGSSEQ